MMRWHSRVVIHELEVVTGHPQGKQLLKFMEGRHLFVHRFIGQMTTTVLLRSRQITYVSSTAIMIYSIQHLPQGLWLSKLSDYQPI
ncbi:hypothetical protein FEM48_Zijuj03G0030800 [Ziziphus jujuba var. spinosa]|uniref:Uncharacterized protein n=1 Tax=Ziziphus jujuba var. spinosa TaxID=714518 RepID=A0A978VMT3_ZIZJJ|nr:hypothetical protein FEM48_Zijuj03G0030800 [Ziziphus jujuba var. spinosa]